LTTFDGSKKAARLNKMHISNQTTDKIRRNPESQTFCGLALAFALQQKNIEGFGLTMAYEAHLNISQNVFVDRFLYTTVVKWTHENIFVFVIVIFSVTVGLTY
jgi:hypothetical protein